MSVRLSSPPIDEAALKERFGKLAAQWREETKYLSSSTAIVMHPSYQEIIGMGPAALPFIFRELKRESDHWYWALKSITGADPVPEEYKGQHSKMREAWQQLAPEHCYQ